jgi:hypothetical protein
LFFHFITMAANDASRDKSRSPTLDRVVEDDKQTKLPRLDYLSLLEPPGLDTQPVNQSSGSGVPCANTSTFDVAIQTAMLQMADMNANFMKQQQSAMMAMFQGLAVQAAQIAHVTSVVNPQALPHVDNGNIPLLQKDGEARSLPGGVLKKLDDVAGNFEKDMRKYLKSQEQIKSLQSDVKFFSDNLDQKRYPSGIRPHGSPPSLTELDESWSHAAGGDFEVKFIVAKDMTRRQSMQSLHWQLARLNKDIELEAREERVQHLRVAAAKQTFVATMAQVVEDAQSNNGAELLGLDAPLSRSLDQSWVKMTVEAKYKKVFEKIKLENESLRSKNEKKEEEKSKILEKMKSEDPKALMRSLVATAVESALGDDMSIDDIEDNAKIESLAAAVCEALSKKRSSPADGLGQNQSAKPKQHSVQNTKGAKGKGKSRAWWQTDYKPKGKGKGAGGKSKGKGKGK